MGIEVERGDWDEIYTRLANLERKNRWLLAVNLAAVCALCAILLTAAARSSPAVIDAKRLTLRDAGGSARVVVDASGVKLCDANGRVGAELSGAGLVVFDPSGKLRISLTVGSLSARMGGIISALELHGPDGIPTVDLSANANSSDLLLLQNGASAHLGIGLPGPALELAGAGGYSTNIGSTSLVTPLTGETHQTSAASVVLFGKKGKIIWQAPPE